MMYDSSVALKTYQGSDPDISDMTNTDKLWVVLSKDAVVELTPSLPWLEGEVEDL